MFKQYANNVYSQQGEDGILKVIFEKIGIENNNKSWAVEFGAWDGKYFNNAFSLVEKGWSCVMIEGDEEKYQDLLKTCEDHKLIVPINKYVSQFDYQEDSLSKILKETNIPKEFELLSIDVDTYDSDIWETFTDYNPKVVVIEINSTPRPGVRWRHKLFDENGKAIVDQHAECQGTTFSETLDIGHKKGYKMVCHTGNGIFVRNDLLGKLDMPQNLLDNQDLLYWGP